MEDGTGLVIFDFYPEEKLTQCILSVEDVLSSKHSAGHLGTVASLQATKHTKTRKSRWEGRKVRQNVFNH